MLSLDQTGKWMWKLDDRHEVQKNSKKGTLAYNYSHFHPLLCFGCYTMLTFQLSSVKWHWYDTCTSILFFFLLAKDTLMGWNTTQNNAN